MTTPSELAVITRAKDLCSYVLTVTQKSPKRFRFTLTGRLQNLALDVAGQLIRANEVYVRKSDREAQERRLACQRDANTSLKLLLYMSQLAMEQGCILMKQFEQISVIGAECGQLLGAWIVSDRRRFHPGEGNEAGGPGR